MRNRSGLHRVTLPSILFINIRCQSRLEGNNDKDYCECGMPLETVRESEAPLKERSERV